MAIQQSGDLQVAFTGGGMPMVSSPVTVTNTTGIPVKGGEFHKYATFNRPADTTAYAVGDLLANSTTAGSVTPVYVDLGITNAIIRGADMSATNTAWPASTTIRWHVFDSLPTYGVGDNGAAFPTSPGAGQIGCSGHRLGYIDVTPDVWLTNRAVGHGTPTSPPTDIHFVSPDSVQTGVWVVPEVRTAFTPASATTFVVGLFGLAA